MWCIMDDANARDADSVAVPCDSCGHVIQVRREATIMHEQQDTADFP
jgi:hypothetical protein